MEERRTNPVYKTMNQPLTIMGVERTAFAITIFAAAGFHVMFGSFFGALAIFAILLCFARWLTRKDPMMLLFIVQAMLGAFKGYYDPCKYTPLTVRRIHDDA